MPPWVPKVQETMQKQHQRFVLGTPGDVVQPNTLLFPNQNFILRKNVPRFVIYQFLIYIFSSNNVIWFIQLGVTLLCVEKFAPVVHQLCNRYIPHEERIISQFRTRRNRMFNNSLIWLVLDDWARLNLKIRVSNRFKYFKTKLSQQVWKLSKLSNFYNKILGQGSSRKNTDVNFTAAWCSCTLCCEHTKFRHFIPLYFAFVVPIIGLPQCRLATELTGCYNKRWTLICIIRVVSLHKCIFIKMIYENCAMNKYKKKERKTAGTAENPSANKVHFVTSRLRW